MSAKYQPVIGLEIHAVLETQSKMFCDCPVVDSTHGDPNSAVCPVCAGMPGMLPVLNQAAVEYALRVALALGCEINETSIFERKSYFYPDLPKGFQISQYQYPLAVNGLLAVETSEGPIDVRIRRVHLEEDTGKLTHVEKDGERYSLVDLNRSGVPLLEIVTEPDMHTVEAVRNTAYAIRNILRYVDVNNGNLEKGLLRIEPNISIRATGSQELSTRAEVKNLNSFRSLERATEYELTRQEQLVEGGGAVVQQTLGWDDARGTTAPQRSKEFAEDYRYFPEPDLPPLVVDSAWVERVRAELPEMPAAKKARFMQDYGLSDYDAGVLTAERAVADFFDGTLSEAKQADAKQAANWVTGPLFGLMNEAGLEVAELKFGPSELAQLLDMLANDKINAAAGRTVLAKLFEQGGDPAAIVEAQGLAQMGDTDELRRLVNEAIANHPEQVSEYLDGNESVVNWLFGQVMKATGGKASPATVKSELESALAALAASRVAHED
jgi:aspartyl-tRNA(Asn)/glutamyl-tRNA(Gln) amidotransferase subunit B